MPVTKQKSVPSDDLDTNFVEFNGVRYEIKTKFKIFKFLRTLNDNPAEALSYVFTEDALELVEDTEFSMQEFSEFMEEVAQSLAGTDRKN